MRPHAHHRFAVFAVCCLGQFFVARTLSAALPPAVDEQYVLGPDSQVQPGVPQGTVQQFLLADSKLYPGFEHAWWLYLPPGYDGKTALPLMVFLDGGRFVRRDGDRRAPVVLDNLIAKRQIPAMAALFLAPGDTPLQPGEPRKVYADSRNRQALPGNRSVEYDATTDAFAHFLLEEIFPLVRQHVVLTEDPEGRGVCGTSSSGIAAFTLAWQRPDQFRKVFSMVGSFTAIRGGNAYPALIRSEPKKPLRVFLQDGRNDLVNEHGSWPEANQAMAAALREKGYRCEFVLGEGSHNPRHGASLLPYVLRWLWHDYGQAPSAP